MLKIIKKGTSKMLKSIYMAKEKKKEGRGGV